VAQIDFILVVQYLTGTCICGLCGVSRSVVAHPVLLLTQCACCPAGELRLLLVRERLWEAACDVLTATAQQPGLPKVLGFSTRRRPGHIPSHLSSSAGSAGGNTLAGTAGSSVEDGQAAFDPAVLPLDMEYVPPVPGPAAAATAEDGTGGVHVHGTSGDPTGFNNLSLNSHPAAETTIVQHVASPSAAGTGAMQQQPEDAGQLEALALLGMCPVSMAASAAARGAGDGGGAASSDAAGGVQGVGSPAGQGSSSSRLLLGQLANRDVGMIRWVTWARAWVTWILGM
jgi:hypothetical protein